MKINESLYILLHSPSLATYTKITNLMHATERHQLLIQVARDEINAATALCHGLNDGALIGANDVVLVAQIGIIQRLVASVLQAQSLIHGVWLLRIAHVTAALLLLLRISKSSFD